MLVLEDNNQIYLYAVESSYSDLIKKQNIKEKKVALGQTLVVGTTGSGKSTTVNSIVYALKEQGEATILYLTEKTGNEFDAGYWTIPPDKKWQLELIERLNEPKVTKEELQDNCLFYHPFTFEGGFHYNKKTIPINFFSISIKDLDEVSLSALLGVDVDKDAVNLCMKAIKTLRDDEDVSAFLAKVYKSLYESNEDSDYKDGFGLPVEDAGTKATLKRINEGFEMFKDNYFLHPNNSETNLNYEEILNNNKQVHAFSSKWLKDKRLKYFVSIVLLSNFKRVLAERENKYPVIGVLEEMQVLLPDTNRVSYEEGFLSLVKEYLAVGRALGGKGGKGGTSLIATTQNYYMVAKEFRSNCNNRLLLKLSSEDKERFKKNSNFDTKEMNVINSLNTGEYVWWNQDDETPWIEDVFMPIIPRFKISDVGDSFFDYYKKLYPERLTDHKKVHKYCEDMREKYKKEAKARLPELKALYTEFLNRDKEAKQANNPKYKKQSRKREEEDDYDEEIEDTPIIDVKKDKSLKSKKEKPILEPKLENKDILEEGTLNIDDIDKYEKYRKEKKKKEREDDVKNVFVKEKKVKYDYDEEL